MKLPFAPMPRLKKYQRYLTGLVCTLEQRQMLHGGRDLRSVLRRAARRVPEVFIAGHSSVTARVSHQARRWQIPFLARGLLAVLEGEEENS